MILKLRKNKAIKIALESKVENNESYPHLYDAFQVIENLEGINGFLEFLKDILFTKVVSDTFSYSDDETYLTGDIEYSETKIDPDEVVTCTIWACLVYEDRRELKQLKDHHQL